MADPSQHSTDPSLVLGTTALEAYTRLNHEAAEAVTALSYLKYGSELAYLGERGRSACRADIHFHLEFLRPVLETGLIQPYVDYLSWLSDVFIARRIPSSHLGKTLEWIGQFYADEMPGEGDKVQRALTLAFEQSIAVEHQPPEEPDPRLWPQLARFKTALLDGERRRATDIVDQLQRSGRSLIEVYVGLVQPSLYGVGRMWQHNQISVAREHLASTTAAAVMAERFAHAPHIVEVSGKALRMRDLHLDRLVALVFVVQRLGDHAVAAGTTEATGAVDRDLRTEMSP